VEAFLSVQIELGGTAPFVGTSRRHTTSISGFVRQESRPNFAATNRGGFEPTCGLATLREPTTKTTIFLTNVRLRTIELEVAFGAFHVD
jgi:hypothetical protein